MDQDLDDDMDEMSELLLELSPCNYAAFLRMLALLAWFDSEEPHDLNVPGWVAGRATVAYLAAQAHLLRFPLEQGPVFEQTADDVTPQYNEARCVAAMMVETLELVTTKVPQLPTRLLQPLERLLLAYRRLPRHAVSFDWQDEIDGEAPSLPPQALARQGNGKGN